MCNSDATRITCLKGEYTAFKYYNEKNRHDKREKTTIIIFFFLYIIELY